MRAYKKGGKYKKVGSKDQIPDIPEVTQLGDEEIKPTNLLFTVS